MPEDNSADRPQEPTGVPGASSEPSPASVSDHLPVFSERVLELLAPALNASDAVYVDATLGLGGHARAVARRWPQVRLIGLDRDPYAIARARARFAAEPNLAGRLEVVHAIYDSLTEVLGELGVSGVHAVLFDLGVSSMQLDETDRGFSYARDALLDMRMDPGDSRTAADVVNGYSARQLAQVLRDYGEERFARRIAHRIVDERRQAPITSTARLAEIIAAAVPAASRHSGGHPAKRTFQALRIEVNGELDAVRRAIPAAIDSLVTGGRIVCLAYHSLEDRIVKRTFAERATSQVPSGVPVVPEEYRPTLRLLTRGAEQPSEQEIAVNPRARSARLRAAEQVERAAA